jgi:hypothetical protein
METDFSGKMFWTLEILFKTRFTVYNFFYTEAESFTRFCCMSEKLKCKPLNILYKFFLHFSSNTFLPTKLSEIVSKLLPDYVASRPRRQYSS